jgi:subtilisin family serine protease
MTRLHIAGLRRTATLSLLAAAVTVSAAFAGALGGSVPAGAAPPEGAILSTGGAFVPNSYIVVLKDTATLRTRGVDVSAASLARQYAGKVGRTYRHALRGFEVSLSETAARRLAANPAVQYVQRNGIVSIQDTQTNPPSWGLDRIDQRNLPLDNAYTYPTTATNVHAYVIDTGILFNHTTFGGRATSGFDAVDGGSADDCNGHGTHVSGTVGGSQYGVAKGVQLVGVRVLDCQGSGTTAQVAAGIDWVTANAIRPAVANMSLGGGVDTTLDNAVTNSIASGVTYAIAAGNGDIFGNRQNACNFSPARVPAAITVGATQNNDAAATFSNYGTCVDILAPGVNITSSWYTSTTATNTISGTSMATPHVAGAAALVLSANPTFTPQQVRDTLVNNATPNVVSNPGTGTPNRLLFVGGGAPPVNDFSISVSPGSGTVAAGSSTSATVSTATTAGSAQTVSLSASGLPAGASASFSPSSVTSGGSSTLTISTSASTPSGTYPVTITGTGASATHTTTFSLTVTGGGGGCSGAGQKLTNPGFESGSTGWTATSGVIGQWGSSGQPAHGGTWSAWLDGYGISHTDYVYQQVALPAGCSSYTLSFWLHIDSAETTTTIAYDTLRVQVLNSSGTVLATLATYSNLNKASGYSQKTFSLAAYAGQTIRVRWYGVEDWSLQTSFVVDDTALNVS